MPPLTVNGLDRLVQEHAKGRGSKVFGDLEQGEVWRDADLRGALSAQPQSQEGVALGSLCDWPHCRYSPFCSWILDLWGLVCSC